MGLALREIAGILDSKLGPEESLSFKKYLLAIGLYIANASGDLLSSKISSVESQTLIELALYMRMSIADYRKEPTAYELMKKIAEF